MWIDVLKSVELDWILHSDKQRKFSVAHKNV